MKTLKQILEVYSPKSADEKRFVKKHIVVKTADAAGNGDDVYTGSNVKEINRKSTRKGYNTKDSEAVYEAKAQSKDEKAYAEDVEHDDEQLDERAKWRTSSIAHNTGYRKDGAHGGIENTADTGKTDYLGQRLYRSGNPLKKSDVKSLKKSITKNLAQMKNSYEEVEQVDELKKSTLKSYIDKARVEFKQGKKSDQREQGIKDAGRKFMSFHGTANKRKIKEEVEVNEVLKVSAGAGEWIKDFQSSDNPKFAGKSKEQRKQQALAAYYAAKRAGKD